jgi:UPF0755 protein
MFKKNWKIILLVLVFVLLFTLTLKTVFPPANFPSLPFYHVDRGKSVSQIADELKTKDFIQSPTAFKVFVRLLGGEKRLQVGSYFFKRPVSSISLALKLTHRFLGYKPIVITVYEGMSNEKIANLLKKKIPKISPTEFLTKTKDLEGRLFPDTYFFSPYDTVDDVIYEMNQNFNEQTDALKMNIFISGQSFSQILIMASLIEREAKADEDRRLVAGILWKRISIGMPLQVDATFEYFTDHNTYTVTSQEMKKDSPYNTYTNKGLPPTPIANPGKLAILAALQPEASPYLYYLTGRDGKMYYAKDFAGHKKNRRLYLN